MKKFVTIVSLMLVFAFCFAALVSCGKSAPNSNYEETVKNLKANGYLVAGEGDSDEELTAGIYAYKEDDLRDFLMVYWCRSEKLAKEYYDGIKMETQHTIDILKSQIDSTSDVEGKKELEEALNYYNKELIIGVKGVMVWQGSKEAIKATY